MTIDYIHGYSPLEQARLLAQARVLEQSVFSGIDFSQCHRILEVGCGVGAQTEIILERFPKLEVWAVDRSEAQIQKAKNYFANHRFGNRAKFEVGDASDLPFDSETFDGAFICWVLEHLKDPVSTLKEVRRCMKSRAVLHLNEVFNRLVSVEPKSEAITQYWSHFNHLQVELGGDPNIGAKLGYYLKEAGFLDIGIRLECEYWDSRNPAYRENGIQYWTELLLSAETGLLEKGRIDQNLMVKVREELNVARTVPEGGVFIGWAKGKAFVQ